MKIRIEVTPDPGGWRATYAVTGGLPGTPALPPRLLGRVGSFPAPPPRERPSGPPSAAADVFMTQVRAAGAAAEQLLAATYKEVTTRQLADTVPFGCYLYQTLVGEQVGKEIGKFLADPQSGQARVELQLVWDVSEGGLTRLPWELMRDSSPHDGLRPSAGFLAAHPRVVIGRRLHVAAAPAAAPKGLRVLFVVGTGPDEAWVRSGGEFLGVLRSVCDDYPFAVELLLWADPNRLRAAVKRFKPTVVHIIGHGSRSSVGEPRVDLCTADRQGVVPVSGSDLAQLLDAADPGDPPRLPWAVIVNACHEPGTDDFTTPQELGDPNDATLRPVAVRLVEAGVAMAVGMSGRVVDQACRLFARRFYEAVLAPGGTDVIAAVAAGRAAGVAPGKGKGQSNPAREVDWAMPTVVLNDQVARLPNWAATPVQVDWYNAANNLRPPTQFPPLCGRIKVLDMLTRLLEPVVPGTPPAGAALRFLILASNSVPSTTTAPESKYGRTWLLRDFAHRIARAGHLPVHVREEPAENSAVTYLGAAKRVGEAIRQTYKAFQLTAPAPIRALGLAASPGGAPPLPDVVQAVTDDLTALRAAARGKLKAPDALLVLLVDNLQGFGADGANFFINDPDGLFESNGLLPDNGFRVACTYETSPGPAFNVVVSNAIVPWANRIYQGGRETLAAFAGPEGRLAFECLLLHWRERDGSGMLKNPPPERLVPSIPGERDAILDYLIDESKGVPSRMTQLDIQVRALKLDTGLRPPYLCVATDEDVLLTVRQLGGVG